MERRLGKEASGGEFSGRGVDNKTNSRQQTSSSVIAALKVGILSKGKQGERLFSGKPSKG